MSHALHTMFEVMIALSTLAVLIWPRALANDFDSDADDSDQTHLL
jgi:hypothetical protein